MKRIAEILEERFGEALKSVCGTAYPAMVRAAADARFGDYQVNGIMPAAKAAKLNPRQLAEQVVAAVNVSDMCDSPEIAGPGFVNLRLKDSFLAERLITMFGDAARLGIDKSGRPKTVVVDYSGPNIAKQMHVGHLRSTIIGDCIARLYDFAGHTVIRQNHIGDWGTQFGKLIAHLNEIILKNSKLGVATSSDHELSDLDEFYKEASKRDETDSEFAKEARAAIARLHKDKNSIDKCLYDNIVRVSKKHYIDIYNRLDVTLTPDDERGESFYADKLADVVEQLKAKGLAVESDGAVCVFLDGFKNKDGDPLPFIIQKSDGAFLYATTDLAALRFRLGELLKADTVIYVTDARQALHFQMLFAAAKIAGWVKDGITLEHITFGTMLGEDNKPFKTRTGGTVKLKDLLNEAVERAAAVVEQKNPDLPAEQKLQIAKAVGVGAVKYADYANNRNSDYVFSFDKMLAMEGNTAPYMQYAYARIQSIERKAEEKGVRIAEELKNLAALPLTHLAEKDLAKLLVRYDQAIVASMTECRPNYLTGYLYDVAQAFSRFYTACPILTAEPQDRPARLLLCDLTARVIRHGMTELLGIEVIDQM